MKKPSDFAMGFKNAADSFKSISHLINLNPLDSLESFNSLSRKVELNPNLHETVEPMSEQFRQALEPVYSEMTQVREQLIEANKRADLAEKKAADRAELSDKKEAEMQAKIDSFNSRTMKIALCSFLVPFLFNIWTYYSDKKEHEKEINTLRIEIDSLRRTVKQQPTE